MRERRVNRRKKRTGRKRGCGGRTGPARWCPWRQRGELEASFAEAEAEAEAGRDGCGNWRRPLRSKVARCAWREARGKALGESEKSSIWESIEYQNQKRREPPQEIKSVPVRFLVTLIIGCTLQCTIWS